MQIELQITAHGGIQMLQNDEVDLRELGEIEVSRASHIEFSNSLQRWIVVSAKTMKVLKDDFQTRAEALAWEKAYYSPSGAGWKELTESQSAGR
jgi:hypothetical protein